VFEIGGLKKQRIKNELVFFKSPLIGPVLFADPLCGNLIVGRIEKEAEWAAVPLPFRVIWQRGRGVLGWGDVDSKITKSCIPFLYTFVEKVSLL
jgi:hypothetical protein